MKIKNLKSQAVKLCSYTIGSGDMYYSEEEKRHIFIGGDAQNGFRIWGELADFENTNPIGLEEILLEDALTCDVPGHMDESEHWGDAFATHFGQAVAQHIIKRTPGASTVTQANLALQCILYSLNTGWHTQEINGVQHHQIDHCPLCAAAERIGVQEAKLAHHILHTLLQNIVDTIDHRLTIQQPADRHAEHTFAIVA